jgi:membrane protease YdiL (CAAX protease family)
MGSTAAGNKQKAISEILVLIGLCITGMLVFSGLAIFVGALITGADASELTGIHGLEEFGSTGRMAMLVMQGLIALGSFVLFPGLIRFLMPLSAEPVSIRPNATILILVTGLSVLMLPVNSWLAAWNQSIQLPEFLNGFQTWAFQKEMEMEKLTMFLVQFSSLTESLLGFLVIAILAGITEEYFFRKLLQPRISTLFGNQHIGIWLTAFIFSAIHIQFYGLIPRMALGALFGYYYYWTGNIKLPMLAHILNNAITLAGLVLYQQKVSSLNVEDPSQIPWFIGAISAGVVWSISSMVQDEADKIRSRKKGI